ncbi:hypothetical protein K437DRAFT_9090 [Tilletiaria anomala UBC 951]|uniref:Trimethylguanosine synthase n=1 Tax=Tilletiaria anomala (strain ATCC 24038 / CBS 436.72 / UBC 951) TaxID=1037660 RepID=A0A066VHA9_TILAU|nr:uncharacterized protein K437DRAFT_9090 [Tilletiaria anomala UBC 951]KDN39693.1 hypothetical protein K437DRAFT_9090 [Tilletiaria anomala UBC 951]
METPPGRQFKVSRRGICNRTSVRPCCSNMPVSTRRPSSSVTARRKHAAMTHQASLISTLLKRIRHDPHAKDFHEQAPSLTADNLPSTGTEESSRIAGFTSRPKSTQLQWPQTGASGSGKGADPIVSSADAHMSTALNTESSESLADMAAYGLPMQFGSHKVLAHVQASFGLANSSDCENTTGGAGQQSTYNMETPRTATKCRSREVRRLAIPELKSADDPEPFPETFSGSRANSDGSGTRSSEQSRGSPNAVTGPSTVHELVRSAPPYATGDTITGSANRNNKSKKKGKGQALHGGQYPPEHRWWRTMALTKRSDLRGALQKYWHKRYDLFSAYDDGILLDEQSWWSVTPEAIAHRIAWRCHHTLSSAPRWQTMQGKIIAKSKRSLLRSKETQLVALDAFCGAGGNTIQLAMLFDHVHAIDVDPVKLELAQHNAKIYGVAHRITFWCYDFPDVARRCAAANRKDKSQTLSEQGKSLIPEELLDFRRVFDLIFLSPPWGGINYQQPSLLHADAQGSSGAHASTASATVDTYTDTYSLDSLAPMSGRELVNLCAEAFETTNIALYVPRNTSLQQISDIAKDVASKRPSSRGIFRTSDGIPTAAAAAATSAETMVDVDVEEEWMGHKLCALTCYFGDLARAEVPGTEA